MESPRVSVIIVSYNRAEDLRMCVESILAADYPNLQVIVVDNASRDGSREVARSFPEVLLIESAENLGFAGGNNLGLAAADGRYVALLNNDLVVDRQWFNILADFLETHPDYGAAGGRAYFWDEANPPFSRTNEYFSYMTVNPDNGMNRHERNNADFKRDVATLSGCAVMIRREAVESVGPVFLEPEFFAYYEETDFFLRLLRKGWRLRYEPAAEVWHRGGTSAAGYFTWYHLRRNYFLYVARNFEPCLLRKILRSEGRKRWRDALIIPWKVHVGRSEKARARRDMRRWLAKNEKRLQGMSPSSGEESRATSELIRRTQAKWLYYSHLRPEILHLVPEDARRVVDVGCGAGVLGWALKRRRPETEVRGVEICSGAAATAGAYLEDVFLGSAEEGPSPTWPEADCLVFADVLEHLRDPWQALSAWAELLRPGGSVVVSVPNVGFWPVLAGIARGRFDYVDAGILDRTHLRFFARHNVREMVEGAGLSLVKTHRVLGFPGLRRGFKWIRRIVRGLDARNPVPRPGVADFVLGFFTVQYVALCRKEGEVPRKAAS